MIVFIELYYIKFLISISSWIAKILFPFPFSNVSRIKYSILFLSSLPAREKDFLTYIPGGFVT